MKQQQYLAEQREKRLKRAGATRKVRTAFLTDRIIRVRAARA